MVPATGGRQFKSLWVTAAKGLPSLTITLTNGKTGEFTAAMNGSFRGESDFGQVDLPVNSVTKVVLK